MTPKISAFLDRNKNSLFVSLGLLFPIIHFFYRTLLWCLDRYTVFDPIYQGYRFCEIILFCYFPTFSFFFFISKNNKNRSIYGLLFSKEIEYNTLYKKIGFIFYYFYFLGKVQLYFSKNPIMGFFALIFSVFIYLYFLWSNSFLIHLRILLFSPYSSFFTYLSTNLIESHESALPTNFSFSSLRQQLLEKKVKENVLTFSLLYTVIFSLLFWLDCSMKIHIDKVEKLCDHRLKEIDSSIDQSDIKKCTELTELEKKKEEIFNSIRKKFFYYKSSLYIFSFLKTPGFEIVSNIIKKLYEKKDFI